MKRAWILLPVLLLISCGKSNPAPASQVEEHAPEGDPASLSKIAAEPNAIRQMIRDRFGEAIARNLRINVEDQNGGNRVEISGEVSSDAIKQALIKELETRLTNMKSEDFTFTLAGPIRQVFTFDAYLRGEPDIFSPDLSLLVTNGGYIYETATGNRLNRMILPDQQVWSMAISSDNKTLALGFNSAGIILYDLPLGRNPKTLAPFVQDNNFTPRIAALQFTPDNKHIVAINSRFGEVLIYDIATGSSKTIGNHVAKDSNRQLSDSYFLALSPDGSQIASANFDERFVTVWNIQTRARRVLDAEQVVPTALAWSHDGKTLAVSRCVGDRRGAVIYDVASGKATVLARDPDAIIDGLAFSPDDKTLAVFNENAGLILWDLASNKEWLTLGTDKVTGCYNPAFSPDGSTLATDCETLRPACVRLWDVSKRPGAHAGPAHLPASANVKTIQDDHFTVAMENDLARTFNMGGPHTIHVTMQADGAVELTGTVSDDRDIPAAARVAENFYLDEKPDQHNKVINHLRVAPRNP